MRILILPLTAVTLMLYFISTLIATLSPAKAETFTFKNEVECLALTLYWEGARGDKTDQAAIAQNVLNRTLHGGYRDSVCKVVGQAKLVNGRKVAQYSFITDDRPHPATQNPNYHWEVTLTMAWEILSDWYSNQYRGMQAYAEARQKAATSTHYHTPAVSPRWSTVDVENCRLQPLGLIGAHLHYADFAKSDPIGYHVCRLARQK